jgi:serine/threonine-protein kinase
MGEAGKGLSSAAALPLPRIHGRRVLLKLAARGGMGDVYLAATTGIEGAERPCIVKTVRRDHMHDGSFLARFLDEARVQAQLQHPGVAQVLEAATDENGEPYTAVEYVEGRSLSDLRQRALQVGVRIAWPDAVAIAVEIAQALAHVHDRAGCDGTPLGIVHRDLSPQNVMVAYAGEVKLIDFGTARGHNRRCRTVAGVVFAKPGYVAPEVARQQVGDGRIDLYALGIMLWELCAGRRFLTGDPQKHLDDAAAGRLVVPPIAAACSAPEALDEAIARLTSNEPDDRNARAAVTVSELARLLSSAPATEGEERGVRPRIAALMRKLWPHEPARSRTEFARLLRDARESLQPAPLPTPPAGPVSEAIAIRMAPEDPAQLAGTAYRLGRKLGEGASGTVYEAEHVELGRKLALKMLAQDRATDHASSAGALERFRQEARTVARLSHRNIVRLYDFGTSLDGRAFLAMELCVGETLDTRLRSGALDWREAVRIGIEAARALEAAHGAGLVHRDLKPQNLMLTTEEPEPGSLPSPPGVKLLDFGLATALEGHRPGDAVLGANGERRVPTERERAMRGFGIFGTPEYMAPEQVAGDAVDGRADLYALGCVLYEMLTGAPAFEGTSSVMVMGKQLHETPLPPRARAPRRPIPRAVEAVVVRAMAKRPEARFPGATAMRLALEDARGAPARRRDRFKRVAGGVAMATALATAAIASARWARVHAPALEASNAATAAPLAGGQPRLAMQANRAGQADPSAQASQAGQAYPSGQGSAAASPTSPFPAFAAFAAFPASPAVPSLRDARAAAHAHPSSPRALEAWTRAALRAGELRDAHRAASAWALHDGTVEPRLAMADILDASGRRPEAVALLTEWLEAHPDAADARAALAHFSGDAVARR